MGLLIKFSLFLIFLVIPLWASVPSYENLKAAPKGLVKDYYIYRFANEKKASKAQLKKLRGQIFRYQGSIKALFDKKIGPIKEKVADCSKYNFSNIHV